MTPAFECRDCGRLGEPLHASSTSKWRYTEWAEPGKEPVGVELYDHQADPGENVNLAHRPETKERVAELKQLLHAGFKAALPPGVSAPPTTSVPSH